MTNKDYRLLDSGDYQKLEIIGGYKIIRPSLNSPYSITNEDLWKNPDALYTKNDRGSGSWEFFRKIPESFSISIHNFIAKIKLTPFGHIGIFPEQLENWKLIETLGEKFDNLEVLNLFAYSGMSTLACLNGGMSVCHVDSSKGMVDWAKENAKLSNLADGQVRWIVDDVIKFLEREKRRNKKYNGFILDPPSFGRGSKGEIWKIEDDLIPLIDSLMDLCNSKPKFVILSCHTTGFSPMILERILKTKINGKGKFSSKEISIQEESKNYLSNGFCSYYIAEG